MNNTNEFVLAHYAALLIAKESQAIKLAKKLLEKPLHQDEEQLFLINSVEALLKFRFSHLSLDEIRKELNVDYVAVAYAINQKGRLEEAHSLVMRLLTKRFRKLSKTLSKKIAQLSLAQLEQLTDDFLTLTCLDDLKHWLANQSQPI